MALAVFLNRAANSTRYFRGCVAAATRQSIESNTRILPQKTREFHRSVLNECHGKGNIFPAWTAQPRTLFHRCMSTEATQLEDADNVYYDGLVKRIASGDMQMIDVRDASEIAEFGTIIENICHIPVLDVEAALKLSDDEFRAKYGHPKPNKTDDNIVFTCKKGIRSLKARDTARELGFTKARHFPGGWMQWAKKNNLPSPEE